MVHENGDDMEDLVHANNRDPDEHHHNHRDDDDEEEDEDDEEDLEKLQAEIARMEAEAARISHETEALNNNNNNTTTPTATDEKESMEKTAARDKCSVYIGQVDYTATPEALVAHFEACGTVERVTIVCDKFTGKPKGFAYLEFEVHTVLRPWKIFSLDLYQKLLCIGQ